VPQDYVCAEVNGVWVHHLRVTQAPRAGKCARSGQPFKAGATVGYKLLDALSGAERAAAFGTRKAKDLTVLLTPEELDPPPALDASGCCRPDGGRLAPFGEAVAVDIMGRPWKGGGEWEYGVLSGRTVAHSCGRLTRKGEAPAHRHDPAELELCVRLATEAADLLNAPWRNDPRPRPPAFHPYFAAAVRGEPVPAQLTADVVRAAFGSALHPGVSILLRPIQQQRGKWAAMPDAEAFPREDADLEKWADELGAAADAFGRWFLAVPGLRGHTHAWLGYGNTDPGPVKPRLVLALTPAGSLVGAASHVVQA
jgi:hypothetical protein